MTPQLRPMPLIRVAAPFDHPDWLFELKHDGFRALAHVDGHHCTLVSRRRHVYRQFPQLQVEVAHSIRAHSAVLDGEIVCLASDGRSVFNRLLFRRDWPHFIAFDVLSIDGEDLRDRPLVERKRRLRDPERIGAGGTHAGWAGQSRDGRSNAFRRYGPDPDRDA